MRRVYVAILVLTAVSLVAGCNPNGPETPTVSCSDAWYQSVEERVPTGDGQGHGPDVGSDEWKSVVEFKLGIRGDPSIPDRDSDAWCAYIDARL